MKKKQTKVRVNYKEMFLKQEQENKVLRDNENYLRDEADRLRKTAIEDKVNLTKDIIARDKLLFHMRHEDQFDSELNLNIEKAVMDTNFKFKDKDKLINHPTHYKSHPSGIECIEIVRHMNFNRGNAIKYIWRAGKKQDELHDLGKAIWYLKDEIERVKNAR